MKHSIVKFKNLSVGLKELEPFIRDGKHLLTGKKFKRFGGMRSRELLANWLLCVTLNFEKHTDQFTFTSDPLGGDGIINNSITNQSWPTEHVLAYSHTNKRLEIKDSLLEAIKNKHTKGGKSYASGKTLIVFLYTTGIWIPKIIAELNQFRNLDFDGVWIVGLSEYIESLDSYIYNIVKMEIEEKVPIWQVRIESKFDKWKVERIE